MLTATLLVPLSASAEEKRFALRRYEASGACPSQPEFVAMVRGYTQRWSLVPEGHAADLTIDVRMAPRGTEIEGTVAVTIPSGDVSRREIAGPSCTEVSQALAVMVAVLLEPHSGASGETATEPPRSSEVQGDTARPPAMTTVAPVASPAASVPAASTKSESPTPIPVPRPAREPATVSLDLRAETTSAVVRGALPGLGASVAIAAPSSVAPAWLPILKPSVGIGVRQSFAKDRALPQGSVQLLWSAAEVRVCPVSVAIGRTAALSPCGEMNVGVLRVSASGLTDARSVSTSWLDLGGSLWLSVPLSKTFFLSSTVLMTVPFNRQPFITDSGMRVASVPPVGVLGGIGVGAKVWSF